MYFTYSITILVAAAPSGSQQFGVGVENIPPLLENSDSSDDDDDDDGSEDDAVDLPSYSFRPEHPDNDEDDCGGVAAVDVWYFARALDTRLAPPVRPKPEDEPILTEKPKTPFVGCKACKRYSHFLLSTSPVLLTTQLARWKTYKNTKKGGITSTFRAHLKNKHGPLYEQVCRMLYAQGKLKASTVTGASSSDAPQNFERTREKFTQEGFLLRLMRWIVADDQVHHMRCAYCEMS